MTQETRPRPKEQENLLIKTLEDVIDGRRDIADLLPVLNEAVTRLQLTIQDFNRTIESQPRNVQDACFDIANSINMYFEKYQRILSEATSYVMSCDTGVLQEVVEDVTVVTEALNREYFLFHQTAWKTYGPTQIPGINQLISTARRILNGENVLEAMREQLSREAAVIEDMLVEMDNSGEAVNPIVKAAYEDLFGILEAFFLFFETRNTALVEKFIDSLLRVSRKFEKFNEPNPAAELSQGPTSSPMANMIINGAYKVQAGEMDFNLLADYLQLFWDQVQNMRFQYMTLMRTPAESPTVQREAEAVGDMLQNLENALGMYLDMVDAQELDRLDEAESSLQAAVEAMDRGMQVFKKLSEHEGKVPCIRCGHYNLAGKKVCDKCGFALPSFSMKEPVQPDSSVNFMEAGVSAVESQNGVVTEKIQQLFDAAQALMEDKMTTDAFEKLLDTMTEHLEKAYGVANQPVPPVEAGGPDAAEAEKVKKIMEEAAGMYMEGLEDFEAGLTFLRQFAHHPTNEVLQTGMQMIWQGTRKLQQVQKVTEPLTKRTPM